VDDASRAKVSGLLGLGARARNVVVGVDLLRAAVKKGTVAFAFVAPDASTNSRDKVVPLLDARRVRWSDGLDTHALGAAVGRETVTALGITDAALARGIRQVLEGGATQSTRDADGTRRSR
jgi:ribosomal protein L7Ae-like RNA K-turn-binding protein